MFISNFLILLLIFLLGCNSSGNTSRSEEIQGCIDSSACNYNADATINDDSCTYTNCTNNSCNSDVCISIQNVSHNDNSLDILIVNTIPVAGFQFNLNGIKITGAGGGFAAVAGFSVTNSATTILGFSFGGASIPSGSSLLTQVSFAEFNPPLCIKSPIFSDVSGNALSVLIGECYN